MLWDFSNIVPEIAKAAQLLEEIEMNGDGDAKQIVDGGCLKGDLDGPPHIHPLQIPKMAPLGREVGPNASKISRPGLRPDLQHAVNLDDGHQL